MNDHEVKFELCGKNVLIPKKLIKKYMRPDEDEWVSIYYYKKKPMPIKKSEIINSPKNVKSISSRLDYRKGVFYKMTQASSNDLHFNYYFKLKEEVPNLILTPTKTNRSSYNKNYKTTEFKYDNEGRVLVEF